MKDGVVHVLKYADDRIDELKNFNREQIEIEIRTEGAKGLSFKLGAEKDSGWHFLEALNVPKVSDTAGAGDWCTSGFLHYLSSKKTNFRDCTPLGLANALRYGQALAALNCTQSGARGLTKQFDGGYLKNKLENLLTSDLLTANFESLWSHVSKDLYLTLDVKLSQAGTQSMVEKTSMVNDLCCKSVEIWFCAGIRLFRLTNLITNLHQQHPKHILANTIYLPPQTINCIINCS